MWPTIRRIIGVAALDSMIVKALERLLHLLIKMAVHGILRGQPLDRLVCCSGFRLVQDSSVQYRIGPL